MAGRGDATSSNDPVFSSLKQSPSLLGGHQGGKGEFFGVEYSPGSMLDLANEAFAGPHDFWNSGYWYTPSGNAINHQGWDKIYGEALNGINVIGAAPFAIAPRIRNETYLYKPQ